MSANLDHDPWAREAKAHWQKYRPKMVKEMRANGSLEHHLRNAVQRAQDQYGAYVESGMHPLEAESEAKRNYLLLPDEDDMPLLGENPDALPDPANLMTAASGNRRKRIKNKARRELTDRHPRSAARASPFSILWRFSNDPSKEGAHVVFRGLNQSLTSKCCPVSREKPGRHATISDSKPLTT